MKMLPSTKILIGFLAVSGAGFLGWNAYANAQVSSVDLGDLVPGRVNLIAVSPDSGYRIVVANQIATLMEKGSAEFGAPEDRSDSSDGSSKKRLPIGDWLNSLNGDQEALNRLVTVLNKLDERELPPEPVIWRAEDIQSALDGDTALKKNLISDLNVNLDGTPLENLRISALESGIVLEVPVPIETPVSSGGKPMVARVREWFRPKLAFSVMKQLEEKSEITDNSIRGFYIDESRKVLSGEVQKEDVAKNLLSRFSPSRVKQLAETPNKIMKSMKVILNTEMISSASYEPVSNNRGTFYDVTLEVTEVGRKRLWRYSRENPGFQLLFTTDGVAIGAPIISGELMSKSVKMSQMPDEGLVKEAVDAISSAQGARKSQ